MNFPWSAWWPWKPIKASQVQLSNFRFSWCRCCAYCSAMMFVGYYLMYNHWDTVLTWGLALFTVLLCWSPHLSLIRHEQVRQQPSKLPLHSWPHSARPSLHPERRPVKSGINWMKCWRGKSINLLLVQRLTSSGKGLHQEIRETLVWPESYDHYKSGWHHVIFCYI